MTKQIFDLTKQSGERTLRANNFYNKTSSKKLCVKQNPTHGTAIHYSQKLNDIHELKPHERDYAVILDWSDDVVSYTSNIQLSASINKVTKTQKFSFLVHYKDKQVLVDIGSSQSPRHSNPRFSNQLQRIAAANNFEYQFLNSESIRGPLLRNVLHIRSALSKPCPLDEFKEFTRASTSECASILSAQDRLRSVGKNPDLIRQFVAHGLVNADLNTPWTEMHISWEAA